MVLLCSVLFLYSSCKKEALPDPGPTPETEPEDTNCVYRFQLTKPLSELKWKDQSEAGLISSASLLNYEKIQIHISDESTADFELKMDTAFLKENLLHIYYPYLERKTTDTPSEIRSSVSR